MEGAGGRSRRGGRLFRMERPRRKEGREQRMGRPGNGAGQVHESAGRQGSQAGGQAGGALSRRKTGGLVDQSSKRSHRQRHAVSTEADGARVRAAAHCDLATASSVCTSSSSSPSISSPLHATSAGACHISSHVMPRHHAAQADPQQPQLQACLPPHLQVGAPAHSQPPTYNTRQHEVRQCSTTTARQRHQTARPTRVALRQLAINCQPASQHVCICACVHAAHLPLHMCLPTPAQTTYPSAACSSPSGRPSSRPTSSSTAESEMLAPSS